MKSPNFSISIPADHVRKLDEIAIKKERNRNLLIRKAVEEYLEKEDKKYAK